MNSITDLSKTETRNLADAFLSAIRKFYEDPDNVRKFEEWKKLKESAE